MPRDHMMFAEAPGIMMYSNQEKQGDAEPAAVYPIIRKAKAFHKIPADFCFCPPITIVSLDQPWLQGRLEE